MVKNLTLQHSDNKDLSIYIHWPFCLFKCHYCDFNSHVRDHINENQWIEAYLREIDYFQNIIKDKNIVSIFFGGGTPSLMPPILVEKIISKISKIANLDKQVEITLEANPTSSEKEKFLDFKKAGINRLSLGVQSLDDEILKFLTRKHSSIEAIKVVEFGREIFDNFSIDLIYACPGQDINKWKIDLKLLIKMAGEHISLYQLMIEKGTKFFKLFKEGIYKELGQDESYKMYRMTDKFLKENGFIKYEISNYAKKGYECIHNLRYWKYKDYLGIGAGAHSRITINGDESNNLSNKDASSKYKKTYSIIMEHAPEKWFEINKTKPAILSKNILTEKEILNELILMGLRQVEGFDVNNISNYTNMKLEEIFDFKYIEYYSLHKYLKFENSIMSFTQKGMVLMNYILPRLLKI